MDMDMATADMEDMAIIIPHIPIIQLSNHTTEAMEAMEVNIKIIVKIKVFILLSRQIGYGGYGHGLGYGYPYGDWWW